MVLSPERTLSQLLWLLLLPVSHTRFLLNLVYTTCSYLKITLSDRNKRSQTIEPICFLSSIHIWLRLPQATSLVSAHPHSHPQWCSAFSPGSVESELTLCGYFAAGLHCSSDYGLVRSSASLLCVFSRDSTPTRASLDREGKGSLPPFSSLSKILWFCCLDFPSSIFIFHLFKCVDVENTHLSLKYAFLKSPLIRLVILNFLLL